MLQERPQQHRRRDDDEPVHGIRRGAARGDDVGATEPGAGDRSEHRVYGGDERQPERERAELDHVFGTSASYFDGQLVISVRARKTPSWA